MTRPAALATDWRLAKLYEALADEVENMTDEELLAESIEHGEDPTETKRRLQAMLHEVVEHHFKGR